MIPYLLDGRALQDGSAVRGIGTYLRGLLQGFSTLGAAADVGVLLETGPVPSEVLEHSVATHPARLRRLNRHIRPMADPFQVRRALGMDPPLLYHAVEYAQPVFPNTPVVVTVHDLIPFVMPDLYPWMRRERAVALQQLRHADAVIAVSRSTADDAERLAHVEAGRIRVIPEGVVQQPILDDAEMASVRRQLGLPDRFVLAVGTFDPRKRIRVLAEVVRLIRREHDVGLIIAGEQGSFLASVASALRQSGIDKHARLLGHVTSLELRALYQAADCLLFCSAYEGFGLPPLEAMSVGTPVAVFDNSSMRDVVGDAGLVLPDGDTRAMARAVAHLLGSDDEKRRLRDGGRKRAASFTWQRAADATLGLYRTVLAGV